MLIRPNEEDDDDYSSEEEEEEEEEIRYASIPPTAPSSVIGQQHDNTGNAVGSVVRGQGSGQPQQAKSLSRGGNNSPSPSIYSLNHPNHRQPKPRQQLLSTSNHHLVQQQQRTLNPTSSSSSLNPTTTVFTPPPPTGGPLLSIRGNSSLSTGEKLPITTSTTNTLTPIPTLTTTNNNNNNNNGGGGGIPASLDSALDRIQTSLTALHERLTILETTRTGGGRGRVSSSSLTTGANSSTSHSFTSLIFQSFYRILTLLRIIRSTHSSSSTTNLNSNSNSNSSSSSSSSSLKLRKLLPTLFLISLRKFKNLIGNLTILMGFFYLVVKLTTGRGRGRGGRRGVGGGYYNFGVGEWIIKWLVARGGNRRLVEQQ